MLLVTNLNNIEQVLNLSNYWLCIEEDRRITSKTYTSLNCLNERCKIEIEFDIKSLKHYYHVELNKKRGKILKTFLNLEEVYKFLQFN